MRTVVPAFARRAAADRVFRGAVAVPGLPSSPFGATTRSMPTDVDADAGRKAMPNASPRPIKRPAVRRGDILNMGFLVLA
jgi:hypothetical protein